MQITKSIIYFFCFIISTSHSITVDGDPNDTKYVVQPSDVPFFVSLFERGSCAGTIISMRHVVTAAHCVCKIKKAIKTILSDDSTKDAMKVYGSSSCVFDCIADEPNKCDVAVLEYTEDIVADSSVVEVYEWDDEVGKQLEIYGLGLTGNTADFDGKDGAQKCKKAKEDKKLRHASNIVTEANDGVIRYSMDRGGLDLEGMAQDGDSGGPAIIERDGTKYVAGANSGTAENNPCTYGSVDMYCRLSEHANWIKKVLDGNTEDASVAILKTFTNDDDEKDDGDMSMSYSKKDDNLRKEPKDDEDMSMSYSKKGKEPKDDEDMSMSYGKKGDNLSKELKNGWAHL